MFGDFPITSTVCTYTFYHPFFLQFLEMFGNCSV